MRHFLLRIFLLQTLMFLCLSLFSQGKIRENLDSLQKILYTDTIPYTAKISLCNDIIKEAKLFHDLEAECWAVMNLGVCYYKLEALHTSHTYLQRALELSEKINNPGFEFRTKLLEGNLHYVMKDIPESKRYYLQCYEMMDSQDGLDADIGAQISALNGLALTYFGGDEKSTDSARVIAQEALALANSHASPYFRALILYNWANDDRFISDEQKEIFLRESIELGEEAGNMEIISSAMLNKAVIHLDAGETENAIRYCENSIQYARKAHLPVILHQGLGLLGKIYASIGDHEKAYEYLSIQVRKQDSLNLEKSGQRIEELEAVFEAEQQVSLLKENQNRISLLEEQKKVEKLQKRILWGVMIFAIVLSIGIIRTFRRRIDIKEKENRLLESKLEAGRLKKDIEKRDLQLELVNSKQQLINMALDITRKYELTEEMLEKLRQCHSIQNPEERKKELRSLINHLKLQLVIDEKLRNLKNSVDSVHQQFFQALGQAFPDLTETDKEICALIRLGLTNKEIAVIRNISVDSAKVSRYRLRKKIGLESNEDLRDYLNHFEGQLSE